VFARLRFGRSGVAGSNDGGSMSIVSLSTSATQIDGIDGAGLADQLASKTK
jgi:hypothetical protein